MSSDGKKIAATDKEGRRKRLRDRFSRQEDGSRSEEALLELLLTYAIPRKDVQPLAKSLIVRFGGLSELFSAPAKVLCECKGIQEHSAVLLKLVDWIRKHYGAEPDPIPTVKPGVQISLFDREEIEDKEPAETAKEEIDDKEPVETVKDEIGDKDPTEPVKEEIRARKPVARRGTGMFGKAMLDEAIQILPVLPDTESLDEIRSFLRANLHFSAEQTRQRSASYIVRRMFSEGTADGALRSFAKAFPNSRELREVCFYRFLKAEPLEAEIVEDLVLPNIGVGRLSRERIRDRLAEKFPESKSIQECGKAIVDALSAGGIAKADRKKISFAYREIPVFSFAFVLHSEFPEPGMHDIRKLNENRLVRAMLWNPDKLLHALYELRNRGLVSKVSEIDEFRQFTTRHTLAGVVGQIVSERKNA